MRLLPLLRVGQVRVKRKLLDRRRRGAFFVEQGARTILNPPESTGMHFWSVNPYVGCEFGCTYCYARFAHKYVVERAANAGDIEASEFGELRGARSWKAFERWIFVKHRSAVLAALDRDLPRVRDRNVAARQTLAVGTATDPYQPAERQYAVTRVLLDRLSRERGFHIGIVTKSPLICRDVDVLRALQRRHALSIHISLMTVNEEVIRDFEARSPMPHARLRALAKLIDADLNAGVIVAPVLPGITDTAASLRSLLLAARGAGARFAHASPLRLYPAVRAPFLPALKQRAPDLEPRYRRAYGARPNAPQAYRTALEQRFRRLAEEIGIALDVSLDGPTTGGGEQLGFWTTG